MKGGCAWSRLATCAALLLGLLSSQSIASVYTVSDLGALGGNQSEAYAISSNRQVAGHGATPTGSGHAFRWTTTLGIQNLGTLGGIESAGYGINRNGQVVGWSDIPGGAWQAFIWDSVTGMQSLGALGGVSSEAYGINDSGRAVGWAETASGAWEAFTWTLAGGMTSIGTLGGSFSQATSISNTNLVAGWSENMDGTWEAFFVSPSTGMIGIGNLGGTYSIGNGVNDSGHVVGAADVISGETHAYLWTDGAGMQDLGTLGGGYSEAAGINNSGVVVGTSTTTDGSQKAFVWDSANGLRDLNTLIPDGSGWILISAEAINDDGEIVGYGVYQNSLRAFLLLTGPAPALGLAVQPGTVCGSMPATGTVTLGTAAPIGGAMISLSSNNSAARVPSSGSVTVLQGQTTATFQITTNAVSSSQTCQITAQYQGATQTANLTVRPVGVKSIKANPTSVTGGSPSTVTITLEAAAAPGNITVALTSSNLAAPVPASVTVPSGQTSIDLVVNTTPVAASATATLTASVAAAGTSTTTDLTVVPPVLTGVAVNPSQIGGGGSATGTVSISGPAAAAGLSVALSASDPALVTPASITVPSGASSVDFPLTTTTVSVDKTVTLTASAGSVVVTATVTIKSLALQSLSLNPSRVAGGLGSVGTVSLNAAAIGAGYAVTLSCDNPTLVGVPTTIMVPVGSTSIDFPITTGQVTTDTNVTITANAGTVTKSAVLTVTPPELGAITLNPSTVSGGDTVAARLVMTGPAPAAGYNVYLSSSDTSAATVPSLLTVPAGATTLDFTVTTAAVSANKVVTITGQHGTLTKTASLTVTKARLLSVAISPSSVLGGSTATIQVTLSDVAPAGGFPVALASSATAAAPVPASLIIPEGQSSASVTITTNPVSREIRATISASNAQTTKSAVLTVQVPRLVTFTLNPTAVRGGGTSVGTVQLNAPAPAGGATVTLYVYSGPAQVPTSVIIPQGQTTATFTVTSWSVTYTQQALINAKYMNTTLQALLTVTP